ncbi:MAG TPA: hypothetical protein VG103_12055 [Chthoniobacterales bacterium]|jgi:hypothetical protein|nr:hypothetical protein [Chthoniobacterales bacterium]
MNGKLILVVVGVLAMRIAAAEESSAAKALSQIKSLAGDWTGTAEWSGARSGSYAMNASYYVTGNGSALVENLIAEGSPIMTSVYHLDGADLRMTHFCGAQNQPRLKAEQIDLARGLINFAFVDITNLRSADAAHVHGMEMRLIDSNHINITFLFRGGGKDSRELIDLKRSGTKT